MKQIRVICLFFCCLFLLSACNESGKQIEKSENYEVVNSYNSSEENNIPEKEKTLKSYDSIDIDLLKLENKEENMVYSPLSIKYALGMLREGASDEMKVKINKVIEENFEPSHRANSKNYSLANGLFIRNNLKNAINSEFINNAKDKYQADIVFDDFSDAETINGWIKDKTFGILDQVMTDSEISELDVALINTIAIDMDWIVKFPGECSNFGRMTFYKTDNTEKDVLGLSERFDIFKVELPEGFIGYEYLPYQDIDMTDEYYKETGESFSYNDGNVSLYQDAEINVISKALKEYDDRQLEFVAIMPKNKILREYVNDFSSKELNAILAKLTVDTTKDGYETFINTEFPKFQFAYEYDLEEDLIKLGLEDIFSNENNNFQKIMDSFYISDAKQKTQIDVNEQGIKVASATIMGGAGGGGIIVPSVYVNIIMDHPFLFFIIEKDTKDIVFTGTMYEPTDYDTACESLEGGII